MLSIALVFASAGALLPLVLACPSAEPAHHPIITSAPIPRAISTADSRRQRRAADPDSGRPADECYSTLSSLLVGYPTPAAPSVTLWLVDRSPRDELAAACALHTDLTPPASVASAYSDWSSSAKAWTTDTDRRSEAQSIATSCGGYPSELIELVFATDMPACASAYSAVGASLGQIGTGTGAGPVGPAATSSSSMAGGAGSKETWCAAAAAAVAVAGVVAAL